MKTRLHLDILRQPDNFSCGATCLHAIYRYYNDDLTLQRVIDTVEHLEGGGTLGVLLARHALDRGYNALIYTYNLDVFDPTWFEPPGADIAQRLEKQMAVKKQKKLRTASKAYIDFLRNGGEIRFVDLTTRLIGGYLAKDIPILAGLSATYLYRTAREIGTTSEYDDIRGIPTGHFVVLCGYDSSTHRVLVADPYPVDSATKEHMYEVSITRLICSIMLGVLTYDANLLIITPKDGH